MHRNLGKAAMNFATALQLSFNNLKTKKARTILVAFAGSIGIIGIAMILSLSNGVNNYIRGVEEDTIRIPTTVDSSASTCRPYRRAAMGMLQEQKKGRFVNCRR